MLVPITFSRASMLFRLFTLLPLCLLAACQPSDPELEEACVRIGETKKVDGKERIDILLNLKVPALAAQKLNNAWEDDGFAGTTACLAEIRYALKPEPHDRRCESSRSMILQSSDGKNETNALVSISQLTWGDGLEGVPETLTETIKKQIVLPNQYFDMSPIEELAELEYEKKILERTQEVFSAQSGDLSLECRPKRTESPQFICFNQNTGEPIGFIFREPYSSLSENWDGFGLVETQVLANTVEEAAHQASSFGVLRKDDGGLEANGACVLSFEYEALDADTELSFYETYPGDPSATWVFISKPK